MAKKMKLIPSIFKQDEQKHTWQWPSCAHPKTLSFRAGDDMYKTVNSVFFDLPDVAEMPESWFTSSPECASFSMESEKNSGGDSLESIIRGARSDRLFFEPENTSSILNEVNHAKDLPFKESVMLAMESDDPYVDFKKSMQEMVEIHRLKDWENLEELLSWYLRMNGKMNHGFIVGAFVDLLMGLASSSSSSSSSCSDSTSYSSAASSFSSPASPPSPPSQIAVDKEDTM